MKLKKNDTYINATYAAAYQTLGTTAEMRSDMTYRSDNGGDVWGVKLPVLTKHIYEDARFSETYPAFLDWLTTDGRQAASWYLPEQSDGTNLVKWW